MASAGTIVDENTTSANPANNTTIATESVCPKGWTLPDVTQSRTIGPSTGTGSDQYVSVFLPVLGGSYGDGVLNYENTNGASWSSEAHDGPRRYRLNYENGLLRTYGGYRRYSGLYIRCVQKS